MKTKQTHLLDHLHNEVPGNYYDVAIKTNKLQQFWHTTRFRELKKMLRGIDAKKVLDVGCHGGKFTSIIASQLKKTDIYGIDVSKDAIQYAAKKYKNIKFKVAKAEKIPFSSSSFDLVTCLEVMEHVDKPLVVISEIKRVMKKKGIVIILVPQENLLFKTIWLLWTHFGPGKVWNHTHVQKFDKQSLSKLLHSTGFTIIQKKTFLLNMLLLIKARKN